MNSLIPWKKGRTNGALARRSDYPLDVFRSDFDSWFDRLFSRWGFPVAADAFGDWGLSQAETDDEVRVRIDAPGFEPDEFDIQVSGNTLKVTAEHKTDGKDSFEERRLERFVTLPTGVDAEKVAARYRNGVLEVKVPKTERAKWRSVKVTAD
jgi:HSP20 family protein